MKFLLIFLSLFIGSWTAVAGHESGNGGGGMRCKAGGQTFVSLLDLWEGEKFANFKIIRTQDPIEKQINDAISRLTKKYKYPASYLFWDWRVSGDGIKMAALRMFNSTEKSFLPANIGILPPSDAVAKFFEKGCELVGIASYDDAKTKLSIDKEQYLLLRSETDKAALFVHEAIYERLRKVYNVKDSRISRYMTACAFTENECEIVEISPRAPENGALLGCLSSASAPGKIKNIELLIFGSRVSRAYILDIERFQTIIKSFFDFPSERFTHDPVQLNLGKFSNLAAQFISTASTEGDWNLGQTGIPSEVKIEIKDGKLRIDDEEFACGGWR